MAASGITLLGSGTRHRYITDCFGCFIGTNGTSVTSTEHRAMRAINIETGGLKYLHPE
jgi:hypothetical protein